MSEFRVDGDFLYECMPALEEKVLQAYREEKEQPHEFSSGFERKMRQLIKRMLQKERYGFPVTTVRRAAAVIVVAAGVMAASLSVEAVRDKVYEFVRTIYETFTETMYSVPEGTTGEFRPLYPAYIPEGYVPAIEDRDENSLVLSYEKEDENGLQGIVIAEDQITDGLLVSDDNEYVSESIVEVLGQEGTLSRKEDGYIHVRWEADGCLYMVAAGGLTEDEVLKICNSLK